MSGRVLVLDPICNGLIYRARAFPREVLCLRRRQELAFIVFPQPAFPIQSDPATPMPTPPRFQMRVFLKEGDSGRDFCLQLIESPDGVVQETQFRKYSGAAPGRCYRVLSWSVCGKGRCSRNSFGRMAYKNIRDWKIT